MGLSSLLGGRPYSEAYGVSADGSVIVEGKNCMKLGRTLTILTVAWQSFAVGSESLRITDVSVEPTSSTLTVRWRTNIPADSCLHYTTSRSLLSSPYCALLRDETSRTEHQVTLSHLPGGLELFLRAESHGAEDQTASSDVLTARTRAGLRNFLVLGPFPSAGDDWTAQVVQANPDFDAVFADRRWRFCGSLEDTLDLGSRLADEDPGRYFVSCYLFTRETWDGELYWLGPRPAVVWLNRRSLVPSGPANPSGEQTFPVRLQRGWNLFLARVEVRGQGEEFSCRFVDGDGQEVAFPKVSFVDPRPRFEVQVEKQSETQQRLSWEFRHPYVNPKWIQSGWGRLRLADLEKGLPELEEKGRCFDGITIGLEESLETPYGGFWPFSTSVPLNYEALAPQVERIRRLPFNRWNDNFVWVAAYLRGEPFVDWLFDDREWETVRDNFRVIAQVIREAGLTGMFLDCETPNRPPVFTYANGIYDKKYPDAGAVLHRAYQRGAELMAVMQAICPDLVIISVDGSRSVMAGRSLFQFHWGHTEVSSARPGWMPEGAKHRLFAALLAGMMESAPGTHLDPGRRVFAAHRRHPHRTRAQHAPVGGGPASLEERPRPSHATLAMAAARRGKRAGKLLRGPRPRPTRRRHVRKASGPVSRQLRRLLVGVLAVVCADLRMVRVLLVVPGAAGGDGTPVGGGPSATVYPHLDGGKTGGVLRGHDAGG